MTSAVTGSQAVDPALVEALGPLLEAWIPRQRWFGGKDAPVERVRVLAATRLRDPGTDGRAAVDHLVVAVDQGGRRDPYQLLLATGPGPGDAPEGPVVGTVDGRTVTDALHDPAATVLLLDLLRAGAEVDGIAFEPEPDALPTGPLPARVLGVEQSNTSLVYGRQVLVKVFRRLQAGTNPDIEVHRALTRAGCPGVAPLLGAVEGGWTDPVTGEPVRGSLAMAQAFVTGAVDGWEAALAAVATGRAFTAEAEALGRATAQVHAAMAAALPAGRWAATDLDRVATAMERRLDEALVRVAELRAHADGLRATYGRLRRVGAPVPVQRIHGDLHLGQALRGAGDAATEPWVLVDFEGEPAAPLAERVALQPAVRDVAGMLRSFDYAARHGLAGDAAAGAGAAEAAARWAAAGADAFCRGYAAASGHDPREQDDLLRAFECDKAVYEAVYEANNRPTWLPIPLGALERLVPA